MRWLKKIFNFWFCFKNRHNAIIGKECIFGRNSRIINKTGNRNSVVIGDNVMMHGSIIVEGRGSVILKDFVNIRRNVYIGSINGVVIGDGTIISNDISIMDNNNHPVSPCKRSKMVRSGWSNNEWSWSNSDSGKIIIGKNVWICQGARILKGVNVGDNSIIAADSVVTKSVNENSIVAGNPARFVKFIYEE